MAIGFDVKIEQRQCDEDHPDAQWIETIDASLSPGFWTRFEGSIVLENSFVLNQIKEHGLEDLDGFLTCITTEFVEDVESFHGGVIPIDFIVADGLKMPLAKRYNGTLKKVCDMKQEGCFICALHLEEKE